MAIVRVRGKPQLFVTMTMDVNCPEILAQLEPGQSPYDRPDIIVRVFQMKKQRLIDHIVKEGCFGKCTGYVAVNEFQKRGAPHCHMLFWIEGFGTTPFEVDNAICAEIPHPDDPLHETIREKMIHGPCGPAYNTNLGCVCDGKCKRNFPKCFQSDTRLDEGSYPQYRRRSPQEGGYTTKKFIKQLGTHVEVDNRWAVPYSPYLMK